jgi:hypothetical protein
MYRVWYAGRWIENVPVDEAAVFKAEGHVVLRMDLPYSTPPRSQVLQTCNNAIL